MSENYILLKWGTLKGYRLGEQCMPFLREYYKDGVPMSCIMDRPDEKRREVLCKLIDAHDGPIERDWTGEEMTKEEAKRYVRKY